MEKPRADRCGKGMNGWINLKLMGGRDHEWLENSKADGGDVEVMNGWKKPKADGSCEEVMHGLKNLRLMGVVERSCKDGKT